MRDLSAQAFAIAALVARRSFLAVVAGAAALAIGVIAVIGGNPLSAQPASQAFAPSDEAPEELPAGRGRDETFYACTPCHNFKLVAQQGMSRRQWDESIVLMIEKHNMPELSEADRKLVLDYLETTYPPRAPAQGGWQNPFMRR
jgi:hypothetical protein